MSVAIIGGTGFMGSAVVDTLPLRGLAPIVIARGQRLHPAHPRSTACAISTVPVARPP